MTPLKTKDGILIIEMPSLDHLIREREMDANNKLVFGVGINDANYVVSPKINGKQIKCKIYSTWLDMLRRCYDESYLSRFPSYSECTVCEDWRSFSTFKSWMELQDYDNMHLDKDVLLPGNKVYSPDYCAFISSRVNLLLTDSIRVRGDHKIGAYKTNTGYQSKVQNNGIHEYLGTFKSESLAHEAYVKRKIEIIINIADMQECDRVKKGLERHAKIIGDSIC